MSTPVTRTLRLVSERDEAPPSAVSDDELVRGIREDDPSAATMVWNRYAGRVRRMLIRVLGSRNEIDDLLQEVFLRVFVRVPSLRDPSALRPFILSIAANVLKWEIRRRWIGRRIRLSSTGRVPDMSGPEVDAESRQALQRCYTIFETLTANERLALVFRLMEGMTTEEVAAALSVSISTAKRLVNRASSKVFQQIGEDADLRSFFAPDGKEGSA